MNSGHGPTRIVLQQMGLAPSSSIVAETSMLPSRDTYSTNRDHSEIETARKLLANFLESWTSRQPFLRRHSSRHCSIAASAATQLSNGRGSVPLLNPVSPPNQTLPPLNPFFSSCTTAHEAHNVEQRSLIERPEKCWQLRRTIGRQIERRRRRKGERTA